MKKANAVVGNLLFWLGFGIYSYMKYAVVEFDAIDTAIFIMVAGVYMLTALPRLFRG